MSSISFADIEKWLAQLRPDIHAVKWFFELADMKKFMAALGNPQDKQRAIHVAGTSGKTSTVYYLNRLLVLAGQSTGMTVSPHVDVVAERAQINGRVMAEEEFAETFRQFISLPEVRAVDITYFGLLAAFAFWLFAEKALDYTVIEAGMGGRLDATNVISRPDKICVITDIGLDHTKFLGSNLVDIAGEKAGIIFPGNHVFVARQVPEVMAVFEKACRRNRASLQIMPDSLIDQTPKSLPPFQRRNLALARFVYDFVASRDGLKLTSPDMIRQAADLNIPARMEAFSFNGKTIITDGSHNAQKIAALVSGLKSIYPGRSAAVMAAFAEDKQAVLQPVMEELAQITSALIITTFSSGQDIKRPPVDPTILAKAAKNAGINNVNVVNNPLEAYDHLLARPEDLLVVTGSFYLLNHVRPLLLK